MRTAISVAVCLFVLLLPGSSFSQKPNNVEAFMRAKLQHSQKVLEGLTTENFELITQNAQAMALLSEATSWQVLQTPDYSRRSSRFRHAASKVKEAAKQANLDGATLAYVDLTIQCVECHKYVRSVRSARLDLLPRPDPAAAQQLGFVARPAAR